MTLTRKLELTLISFGLFALGAVIWAARATSKPAMTPPPPGSHPDVTSTEPLLQPGSPEMQRYMQQQIAGGARITHTYELGPDGKRHGVGIADVPPTEKHP